MAFRALRLIRGAEEIASAIPRTAEASSDPTYVRDATGMLLDAIRADYGARVTLDTALRVPAFARAYKLYTGTIASFPLVDYGPDGQRIVRSFLDNPSRVTTYTSMMARTVGDLMAYDVAYWRVTERDYQDKPVSAEHIPANEITVAPTTPAEVASEFPLGTVSWNGAIIPTANLIRFDGDGTGGWLTTGVDAITTAAALEAAVLRSAEVPSPSVILKNTGADLPAEQVDALLDAWETARTNRATAYLNSSIDVGDLKGWSPNDLQLVEARNAASTMIGRLCNLDPVWVGAGVPGSSLTYTNRSDLYRQLLDLSLQSPMRQITDRLSMDDITPRGHRVGFDTDTFLRANTTEIAALVNTLIPLGVITTDEGRALLDMPVGGTP